MALIIDCLDELEAQELMDAGRRLEALDEDVEYALNVKPEEGSRFYLIEIEGSLPEVVDTLEDNGYLVSD